MLLIVPLVSFGQKVQYQLLDSSLNIVSVKNINNLSYTERRNIYHYAEYSYDRDGSLIGITNYYAEGKYPTYSENWTEITNKTGSLSFSNAEKRLGAIRSIVILEPVQVDPETVLNQNALYPFYKSIEKYYPNGQLLHKSKYADGKIVGDQLIFNDRGEKIFLLTYEDGFLSSTTDYYGNYYLIFDGEEDNYSVVRYDLNTDRKITKRYYFNGIEDLGKREIYSSYGRILFANEDINENSLKEYFDNNDTPILEGIYTVKSTRENLDYKIAILESFDGKFYGYQLSGFMYNADNWERGEIRTVFEKTSIEGFYSVTWYNDFKNQELSEIVEFKNGVVASFGSYNMIKLYPEIDSPTSKKRNNKGEWAGNGSGIIISRLGHIVTNHHVIEDADDIEVEFMLNGAAQNYNAEIVQSDKVNDLAILKIHDINFDGLGELAYNFQTRSSDVGTKVYAYGYPMALSVMGKEIKITDGIISSKSGFEGDITTYQITAPIQPGNSGGPLFDDKGNFIGINSSGLGKDVSDNVGYTIKSSYVLNLIDALSNGIELPSSTKLQSLPLTEQIKEISKSVVLIKVK